jgi:serine phosphatase RsbU (regulator of sigma subunit)/catechol 2,3-dioxygenase-like lactoylglutathione lyase family enzyme
MLGMSSVTRGSADGFSVRLDRENPFLRLQSVTVFVRDLEQSLEFYCRQLGFQLVFDGRAKPGRRWVTVAPPDGAANLTLMAPEPDSEDYKLIGQPTHITFVTENVIDKFREWSKSGVRFQFTPRLRRLKHGVRVHGPNSADSPPMGKAPAPIWGGVFTRFRDLDGNLFSLVSFDEVTNAFEAQRRAIAEKLESEQRAAQELEIAKQVQSRLFPRTMPHLETLEYAGICHQARQVGGDYYDFLDLGGGRVGLVIGDISGKGIAAALLMANLQANVRSQCAIALDRPERLLCAVNQLFCENITDGSFATLFFAEYDDAARRVRYANCGHLCGLLLRRDNSVERLDSTTTILGAFKEWECEIAETQLMPGDTLALYTDGITEPFNAAGEQFGEERLVRALRRHKELSPQALLTAVVDEVRQFSPQEQQDDITLIVGKCIGNA